ncbi:hypothetical protein ACSYGO_36490 [Streptomyces krungchingensis]
MNQRSALHRPQLDASARAWPDSGKRILSGSAFAVDPVIPRVYVTAGGCCSYYDGVTVTTPGDLDIDHLLPLAEAWDSGAWAVERRGAYATTLTPTAVSSR